MPPGEFRRLKDLTTAGRAVHPDAAAVAPAGWPSPQRAVPGHQLQGARPGLGRFVLRAPREWNGGLVVAGTPGTRTERAGDLTFSDFVLPRGYAYLAGDKAGTGGGRVGGAKPVPPSIRHPFGLSFALLRQSVSMEAWTTSLIELTRFAREQLSLLYDRPLERTYLIGISNGGYQVRRALETAPELYDGGVDWEGAQWGDGASNPLAYLPSAIRNYRVLADPTVSPLAQAAAGRAIVAAGFPPYSEALWEIHNRVYWSLTQWLYAGKLDPRYRGDPAAYDLAIRPPEVHARLAALAATGAIGRPLLTVHGTLDCLLPPAWHALPYAEAVRAQGRAHLHRLYLIERGNHVDNFAAVVPDARLEILLPHVHRAFDLLVAWVEGGQEPPPSQTVPVGGRIE